MAKHFKKLLILKQSSSESNLMPPPLQIPLSRRRNKSDKKGGS